MTRIAVLGGAGFVGANLTKRLVADGHDVRVVDVRCPDYRRAALAGAEVMWADLRSPDFAAQAVAGCEWVVHLAADMGGVAWFHGPQDWPASLGNGIITANVLQACTKANVARLVYTSSACAYATEVQQTEGVAPLLSEHVHLGWGSPDAGYGEEKRYGIDACQRAPFDARAAICHTMYGPLQEHEGGRMKFPAAVATKALQARQTGRLELWGSGRQMRSYLFVDDAVSRLVTLLSDDRYDGPVNVGAQGAVSCEDVARLCLQLAGVPYAEVVTVPGPVGVMSRDCDNGKWQSTYGPVSDVSLADGFGRFMAWLQEVC